jgi:hypothetical protein
MKICEKQSPFASLSPLHSWPDLDLIFLNDIDDLSNDFNFHRLLNHRNI